MQTLAGEAYFVRRPRRLEDLRGPHLVSEERPYAVAKTVTLGPAEYENFTTDMLADRQFIEDGAALCGEGEAWRCLLVRRRGREDGVLVLPENDRFVGWAAYMHGE